MKTVTHFAHIFVLASVMLLMATVAKAATPATLVGISLDYDKMQITIQVVGSGCTQSKDFKFEIKEHKITVVRLKMDYCKAMPEIVSFTYSFKEVGIDANKSFVISNPFIANPNLANIR